MKKELLGFFIFLSTGISAQNLVPNPSFEDTLHCPSHADNISDSFNWFSSRNSPDYFNPCANAITPYVGVPNNFPGHQTAQAGNAYPGLVTFVSNPANSYREFISCQLVQALNVGTKYFVSAYVSRGDTIYYDCATNNMGFRFSTIPYYAAINPLQIDNFSHINLTSIVTNKNSWTKIGDSFFADSAYQYIIIGNFYDDSNTDTIECPTLSNYVAYYYIDNVCVSSDSVLCSMQTGTSISNPLNNLTENYVFPNPVGDILKIRNLCRSKSFRLINSLGINLLEGKLTDDLNLLDVSSLANGIFLLKIDNNSSFIVLVNH